MKERDYLRKLQELQADFKKKTEALETVWSLFNPGVAVPIDQSPAEENSSFGWTFEISKKRAVYRAFAALGEPFTVDDVRRTLAELNEGWSAAISDAQLNSIVSRAASNGKLATIKERVGRSPAVYRHLEDEVNGLGGTG